jgi:hypothetical protein
MANREGSCNAQISMVAFSSPLQSLNFGKGKGFDLYTANCTLFQLGIKSMTL